jgi:putative transposase
MPSRNVVKTYVEQGIYHVYNRGVEKRVIFADTQDHVMFRHYLRAYLLPPDHPSQKKLPISLKRSLRGYDLFRRVQLLAYCQMPNHFHLIVRQLSDRGMPEFVKRLSNAYVSYFNRRYNRVGSLFQGPYRGALVDDLDGALPLSRYVHRNPLEILAGQGAGVLEEYPYSSYPEYLGRRQTEWLHPEVILDAFATGGAGTYQEYVEGDGPDDLLVLGDKALDEEPLPEVAPD